MHRGEIWIANLDPTIGSEIRKTRPVVVVNADGIGKLPLRVVVPLTDWNDKYYEYAWMVLIVNDKENNLTKLAAADCLNLRAIDVTRFDRKLGNIRADVLEDILSAIAIVLDLPP